MNLRKKLQDLLCRIGWHKWSDETMPTPIHCLNCLTAPSGRLVLEVLDEIEEWNRVYA